VICALDHEYLLHALCDALVGLREPVLNGNLSETKKKCSGVL